MITHMETSYSFADAMQESGGEHDYAPLLTPSVQLHSPVLHLPFDGRDTVAPLLPHLRACFTDLVYTNRLEVPGLVALLADARISGLDAQGVQVLRIAEDGLIDDIAVYLRPIRAAMALGELMGPKVVRLPNRTYGLRQPDDPVAH
jgi:hypothetical protein